MTAIAVFSGPSPKVIHLKWCSIRIGLIVLIIFFLKNRRCPSTSAGEDINRPEDNKSSGTIRRRRASIKTKAPRISYPRAPFDAAARPS